MKKISNRWLINYLISLISIMFIEIVFKLISGSAVFEMSLLRILAFANLVAVLLGFFLSCLNDVASKVINLVLTFALCTYAWAQHGFNNFIGVYMSLNTSSQLGAVKDYIREFVLSFKWQYYLSFIPFVTLILYYIFLHKRVYVSVPKLSKGLRAKYTIKKIVKFIFLELSICLLYYATLTLPFMQNKFQTQNNLSLFINPSVPGIVVKQLGITSFGLGDVRIKFFPIDEEDVSFSYQKKIVEETDYSRKIDDTAWETVLSRETNKNYKTLNNYFISQDITPKNDYTGMFEGKNVIVIMLESVGDIIINEEYFPNFYRMYSEGWHWENNYSPRNSCATGNNEMSGMTSLYTINNSCTANVYKRNVYPEAIFNLFNKAGYYTTSMHDYSEAYYYRSTIHKNMGSQEFFGVQKLGIPWQTEYINWASDVDFMNAFLEIMDGWDKEQPFMTWLTTVSSHQPYTVSSILGDKYLDKFKDTGYPKDIQRYMSKLTELDLGLGVLLDGLEERGMLEDTVIVMYGDHYPYAISNNHISQVLDYDLENYENERTPFVIYNPTMEAKAFDEYTFYMNVTPTIANLCNLDYDPRLYAGHDILSEDYEDKVVFADGSWKNAHAYYDASKGKLTSYDDFYTEADISRINEEINLKMSMSSNAIKTNYFKHLGEELDKEQAEIDAQKQLEEQSILDEQNMEEEVEVGEVDDTLESGD